MAHLDFHLSVTNFSEAYKKRSLLYYVWSHTGKS